MSVGMDKASLILMAGSSSQFDATCRALAAEVLRVELERLTLEGEKAHLLVICQVRHEHEQLLARRIETLDREKLILGRERDDLLERCRLLSDRVIWGDEQVGACMATVGELVSKIATLNDAIETARSHCISGSTTLARQAIEAGIAAARRAHG